MREQGWHVPAVSQEPSISVTPWSSGTSYSCCQRTLQQHLWFLGSLLPTISCQGNLCLDGWWTITENCPSLRSSLLLSLPLNNQNKHHTWDPCRCIWEPVGLADLLAKFCKSAPLCDRTLERIPAHIGQEAVYILNRSPVYHRADWCQ